ncbi:NAD-dependent epimerase/dehydratase family protein [Companilactobacillus baiquanensis]|uniref:NAD-dependent epimerase/dehydratase family protein n=1 Tax=Companilactobacillus baiquanensis TaxID=2486005 RepID=A0ABW1UTQ5_9LACO|nr:NAD-dependent epimerase/dehydratase family protein [Companilactobacillus baiquanensis]
MTETVLVTGGTGFLGLHILLQLMKTDYNVRTTIRSLGKKNHVLKILKENGIDNLDRLSFYEANLTSDEGWDEAMDNVNYVLSVASPVFFDNSKKEIDAIRPATDGITRILKMAQRKHVKRVVMTGNFGAIGFSNKPSSIPTTEEDWTKTDQPGISIYEKSKLIAEKAAWKIIDQPSNMLEFTTINPVAMLGDSLDSHVSGSFDIITNILNGSMKRVPNINLNIVDVRDVAALHIKAMTEPKANHERFIASADGSISLPEIANLVRHEYPDLAPKISSKILPDWIIKLGSYFNQTAKEGKLLLEVNRNISNQKAKDILNWSPIADNKEIIFDSVNTLLKNNLI